MSIALRRAALAPILFAFLVLATGAASVAAASPSTVITAASAPTMIRTATSCSRWMAYLNWGTTFNNKTIDILDDLSFDLDITDLDGAYVDAKRLKSQANSGIRWLDTHKPAAAYKSVWTYQRSALTHMAKAAGYWMTGFNSYSVSHINRGTAEIKISTAQTKRATTAIGKVNC